MMQHYESLFKKASKGQDVVDTLCRVREAAFDNLIREAFMTSIYAYKVLLFSLIVLNHNQYVIDIISLLGHAWYLYGLRLSFDEKNVAFGKAFRYQRLALDFHMSKNIGWGDVELLKVIATMAFLFFDKDLHVSIFLTFVFFWCLVHKLIFLFFSFLFTRRQRLSNFFLFVCVTWTLNMFFSKEFLLFFVSLI